MQFEVFSVPAGGGEAMVELNRFLGSHRVIGVEKHLVTTGGTGPVWVFCVEYLRGPAPEGRGSGGNATPKVDYREVLSPEDFAVFSRLREVRKGLAEKDGVPPYSVFPNEQLAVMVRQRVADTAGLEKIDGVGCGATPAANVSGAAEWNFSFFCWVIFSDVCKLKKVII
jgi:hypothetical protein